MAPPNPEPLGATADCRRVIVLGASNVTLGLPLIIDMVRAGFDGPLQLDIADSHGRSYGQWTTIPFRSVPGHLESGIWAEQNRPPGSTHAIVTDIGNDLVYGNTVEQTADWVQQCVARLSEQGAEIVMTQLPLASVGTLGRWRYRLFKTIFFPGCKLSLDEIQTLALDLNQRVVAIARSVNATLIQPQPDWFGLDPIHIARQSRIAAWQKILGGLAGWAPPGELMRSSIPQRLRYWLAKPQRFRRFRREQTADRCYGDERTRVRFF